MRDMPIVADIPSMGLLTTRKRLSVIWEWMSSVCRICKQVHVDWTLIRYTCQSMIQLEACLLRCWRGRCALRLSFKLLSNEHSSDILVEFRNNLNHRYRHKVPISMIRRTKLLQMSYISRLETDFKYRAETIRVKAVGNSWKDTIAIALLLWADQCDFVQNKACITRRSSALRRMSTWWPPISIGFWTAC